MKPVATLCHRESKTLQEVIFDLIFTSKLSKTPTAVILNLQVEQINTATTASDPGCTSLHLPDHMSLREMFDKVNVILNT
jgi:hypothetical protein